MVTAGRTGRWSRHDVFTTVRLFSLCLNVPSLFGLDGNVKQLIIVGSTGEHAVGPASRGRLARARVAVKKHSEYSEHGYFLAVETAFQQWEALQTTGRVERP